MMNVTDVFIDTNVLLYAYDDKAPEKQRKAFECLKPFFSEELTASISVQVLQEFTNQLLRKKFDLADIRIATRPLLYWNIIENTTKLYVEALNVLDRYQLSLWDSLIVAAANQSGAKQLLSEDLNDGQIYGNIVAVNPFR